MKVRAIAFVGLVVAFWLFLGLTLEWVSGLVGLALGVALYVTLKRTILKRVLSAGGISWNSPIEIVIAAVGYSWAVILSNFRVAWLILMWRRPVRTAILRLHTHEMGDLEQAILANSITLTPGTITLEFSPDRHWLYVHILDVADVESARDQIREHLEVHFEGGLRWWKSPST